MAASGFVQAHLRWIASQAGGAGENSPRPPAEPAPRDSDLLDAYSQAVIQVVEAISPAVLSLSVTTAGGHRAGGSGFLITPDGLAVTNSHVVGGSERLAAETDDGDRVDAEVIGDDPATDLALVRLQAADLPYARLGDSDALRVGQLVIAMGSPLGLQSTVSTGVVSALRRTMRGRDGRLIENVVQHAAPINPGNSGGPLLDSRGRVVGVNTAIIPMAQGIGFAVPSNTVDWVVGEILAHGRVRRRRLGVVAAGVRLPRKLVRRLDLLADEAVEVVEVAHASLAERSGIRSGDIIVALGDRLVTSVDDLHRLMALVPADQAFALQIVRGSTTRQISIADEGVR
ncbi:MAG TPA: trypsin-like peptidase domain-containing protein [Pirellulales bacterium]|jgi:S1-C subfamily serine protease|nr:trypsin-like peptidase domain-containing protein [Pirellulales bacterium]